jgi:hypothetical protein
MPIVVKELVIRATVSERPASGSSLASSGQDQISREELIKECVEQVMEILKQKTER